MRFLAGSRYFFGGYPNFTSHDTDYLELLDTDEFNPKRAIRANGLDIIQLKYKPKAELIQDALQGGLPMAVGEFLIPEFCAYIGFTVIDLPKVKPLIDALDDRHKYEEIIYNAYLENGGYFLTPEQRNNAYKAYRKSRELR